MLANGLCLKFFSLKMLKVRPQGLGVITVMAISVLQQVITKLFLNFAKKKLCRLLSVIPIVYAKLGVNNS